MRKIWASLLFLMLTSCVYAQTAVVPVYNCVQNGVQAKTSGLSSSNYMEGIIPYCTITIYLTGTTTIATTTPKTPLTAKIDGSIPPIYAATGVGYDVVFSGGFPPNSYTTPVTLTDIMVGGGGGGGGVSAVTATAPVQSSGGTTPNIFMHVADASDDGYLSSTDWSRFNAGGSGIPYPIGTGIPEITGSIAWGSTYNTGNQIPANFVNLSAYTPTTSLGTGAFATIANYPLISSLGTGAYATIANYLTTAAAASTYQTLLGFTPYNATNPAGYITTADLTPYALLSGAAFTGPVSVEWSSPTYYFTMVPISTMSSSWTMDVTTPAAALASMGGAPTASPTFTGNVNFPGSGIWNSSGNVGIGTTTPGQKLEVNGNILTDGEFMGAGTGLTGTAASLSIGGNAATATNAPLICNDTSSSTTTYTCTTTPTLTPASGSLVLFTPNNSNSAANPTLNINGLGDYTIQTGTGSALAASGIYASGGASYLLEFNGSDWLVQSTPLGYPTSAGITLTTSGTSGAATLTGTVLNVPQYSGGGSGMVWPGAGISVSNGSNAWLASLVAPSSTIVGISDGQTLTNKNIAGSEINSGTVAPAYGGTGGSGTGYAYGNGASAFSYSTTIPGSAVSGNISGYAANITGIYGGTLTSSQVTTALTYTPVPPTVTTLASLTTVAGGTFGTAAFTASSAYDVSGAAAARAGTGTCITGQYGVATTTAGLTCAQVAYSQVSGTPTLGTGTTNYYALFTGASTFGNGHLNDGVTTAGTITSTEPINAPSIQLTGTTPSSISLPAGVGNIPALPANSAGFAAPVTGGTAYVFKLPATITAGILHAAGPTTGDGVNESAMTSSAVSLTADVSGLLSHANIASTAVTPGSYTNTNLTVAADGSITAASNGSGGGGTPGGSSTQFQYNNSGAFGGAPMTYNGTVIAETVPFQMGSATNKTLLETFAYTIAAGTYQLPTASSYSGYQAQVSDGLTQCDATTGGGTITHVVVSNGTAWVSASPLCSIGAAQYDVYYSGGTAAMPVGAAITGFQYDSTSGAPAAATAAQAASLIQGLTGCNTATYVFTPQASDCVAPSSGSVTSVTGTAPVVSSGGTTPAISMHVADTGDNGYLSAADWNTFNGKQAVLGFTPYNATNPAGYITSSALSPYLTSATAASTYAPIFTLTTTGTSGASTYSGNVINIPQYSYTLPSTVVQTNQANTYSTGLQDFSNASMKQPSTYTVGTNTITNPSSAGTLALTSQLTSGTVTGVTGTAPVVSSGGTTPAISIHVADTSDNGYLAAADWNTFNGKQAALGFTPYNVTNPAGYISGITSGNVTTALGFTPVAPTVVTLSSLTTVAGGTFGTGAFATISNYLTTATAASTYAPIFTLTTTGTSGAATYSGNVLNVPQYAGGSSGVSSINSTAGAFTFTGAGVSCTTTICTFTGAGSGIGSIAWSLPSWLTASPSTISASGTQTFSATTGQTANNFLATPNGSSGAVGLRAIVAGDLPSTLVYTGQANTFGAYAQNFASATLTFPSTYTVGSYTITQPGASGTLALTSQLTSGTVTSVTGTAPVISSGGATPAISMHVADASDNGYLTSADWSTFNGKQAALGFTPYNATNPAGYIAGITSSMVTTALGFTPVAPTVVTLSDLTTVAGGVFGTAAFTASSAYDASGAAAARAGTGTCTTGQYEIGNTTSGPSCAQVAYSQVSGTPSLSGYVTSVTGTAPVVSSGGATPAISMHVADASDNGYLAAADWSTFNGKQAALGFTPYNATNPAGYITNSVTTLPSLSLPYSQVSGTPTIPSVGSWGALNYPTWSSGTPFVKMTAAGTFSLDANTYLTGNQSITLGGILAGSGTTSITASAASGYYMPTTTDQSNWNGKISSSGVSGMTATQVPIAGSATTITSSKVLSGSGAGITTGPTSSVANHAATFSGTTGQIQDSNVVITAPGSAATLTPQSGDTYNFPSPPSGSTMTLSGNYWRPNFSYSGVPGVNQLIGIFTPPNDETITINASCTNFKAYEVTAGTTTDTYTLNYWPTNAFGGSATAEAVVTFSSGSTVGSFSSCNGSAWTIAPGTGITITNSGTAATGTTVVVSIEGTHTN